MGREERPFPSFLKAFSLGIFSINFPRALKNSDHDVRVPFKHSYLHGNTPWHYVWRRFLRILPICQSNPVCFLSLKLVQYFVLYLWHYFLLSSIIMGLYIKYIFLSLQMNSQTRQKRSYVLSLLSWSNTFHWPSF